MFIAFAFLSANLLAQEEVAPYVKEDYVYKSNGKSFKIKDAIFITEGLQNIQSTGFGMNVNGGKFIVSNLRFSGASTLQHIKDIDGENIKLPMNVFVAEDSDILFFRNLNVINAIDVDFKENIADFVKEGDEVLVIGNHSGNGTIEERISCIDAIGPSEISLKNFEKLNLYYLDLRDKLEREASDISYREMDLFNKGLDLSSTEIKELKQERINISKRRNKLLGKIQELRNLKRKNDTIFSMSSLGSPVIHLPTGKCIGFLKSSYIYKWRDIESFAMKNGLLEYIFSVERFDGLKKFHNIKLNEINNYSKSILEGVVVFTYANSFVKQQNSSNIYRGELKFPSLDSFRDILIEKEFISKLYQAQVKYKTQSKANTEQAKKNAVNEYYSGLRSVIFELRSRMKNSKAYVAFKKDIDPLLRRMESLEKDLDMVKRYN